MLKQIEETLFELLNRNESNEVIDAMSYSLLGKGKRIRPLLFLTTISCYGLNWEDYVDIACSIEMIHTYSLIHDDLPCMDDDTLRRGRKTCHIVYGEATALLAGDGLLNEAVLVLCNSALKSDEKISCIRTLYNASGVNGMIEGQMLDIYHESKKANLEQLKSIHNNKTGKLISAPFEMAGIIANKKDRTILKEIGLKLGLAFQIQDDVLDVTSSNEILGKDAKSDLDNGKSTYVSLLGVDESIRQIEILFNDIYKMISSLKFDNRLLVKLIKEIEERVN